MKKIKAIIAAAILYLHFPSNTTADFWPSSATSSNPPAFGLLPLKCANLATSIKSYKSCISLQFDRFPIPLKNIKVSAKIEKSLVNTEITMEYKNTEKINVDAVFTFPVSMTTAVHSLTAEINNVTINGEIKPRKQATEIYKNATANGKVASLLEEFEETSDILRLSVGTIYNNSYAIIKISMVDDLPYIKTKQGYLFNYLFPTSLLPRYTPNLDDANQKVDTINDDDDDDDDDNDIDDDTDVAEEYQYHDDLSEADNLVINTGNMAEKRRRKKLIIRKRIDTRLDFELKIFGQSSYKTDGSKNGIFIPSKRFIDGLKEEKIYPKIVTNAQYNVATLSFKQSQKVFEHDFDISINLLREFVKNTANKTNMVAIETSYVKDTYSEFSEKAAADGNTINYLARSVITVNNILKSKYLRRSEYIFLVDCSGSMEIKRMTDSKSMLKLLISSLPVGSFFNLVKFGTHSDFLYEKSAKYNDKRKRTAFNFINSIESDCGGTNLVPALKAVFNTTSMNHKQKRNIFVLTDGAITNTKHAIKLVRQHNRRNRIFSFGIGAGASTQLVNGIASAGKGYASFINEYNNPGLEKYFNKETLANVVVEAVIAASRRRIYRNVQLCIKYSQGSGEDVVEGCIDGDDVDLPNVIIQTAVIKIFYKFSIESSSDVYITLKAGKKILGSEHLTFSNKNTNLKISSKTHSNLIGILYAKRKMTHLVKKIASLPVYANYDDSLDTKNEIIKLSTKSNVISPLTSLVAVEKDSNNVVGGDYLTEDYMKKEVHFGTEDIVGAPAGGGYTMQKESKRNYDSHNTHKETKKTSKIIKEYNKIIDAQTAHGWFKTEILKSIHGTKGYITQKAKRNSKYVFSDKAFRTLIVITELLSNKFNAKFSELRLVLKKSFQYVYTTKKSSNYLKSECKSIAKQLGFGNREVQNILRKLDQF